MTNSVGKNIKTFRIKSSMSQESLANKLNVTRQAVSQWENGNAQPDIDTLKNISSILNADILDIIYGQRNRQSDSHNRKAAKKPLIVFGVLAMIMLVMTFTLKPYLAEQTALLFNASFLVYIVVAEPFLYLFSTLAVLLAGSVLWDFHAPQKIKRAFFLAGLILIMVYYIMASFLLFGDGEIAYFLWSATIFIADAPSLFILPGIGLFFGFVREDATHSNTETDVKAKKRHQKV